MDVCQNSYIHVFRKCISGGSLKHYPREVTHILTLQMYILVTSRMKV